MKQKYTIYKEESTGKLKIQEHAELSKDLFSLICEESYNADTITTAVNESKAVLIDTLRTSNLYPVSEYIDKIADQVMLLYAASGEAPEGAVELVFDDVELFRKEEAAGELIEENVEIEDLLEDETDVDIVTGKESPRDVPIDTSDDESHESPDDEEEL